MNCTFRDFVLSDHRACISLLQSISKFSPHEENLVDIYNIFINQDHVKAIVGCVDETIVAYGSIVYESKIRGGKAAHVEDIVIDPNFRSLGLGKKLIIELSKLARLNGCYKMILQSSPDNVGFYQKAGFHSSGVAMQLFVDEKLAVT